MTTISDLEKRLQKIESRNRQVEISKAWEISLTRRVILVVFTYLSVGLYMSVIGVTNPWLNAIIPSLGFLLSTLTLPFFKSIWVKYYKSI
jgi:hypothetical protein